MSSQKGNTSRQRSQKHKNNFGFKNEMHYTSEKMKNVNKQNVTNVCQRCKDCIEWKIKYKKYKPLTVPSKCVKCMEKKVKYAYHIVCTDCARELKICAKCNQAKEVVGEPEQPTSEKQREENYLREELKFMREREKRTFLRQLERGDKDEKKLPDEKIGESNCDGEEKENCDATKDDDNVDSDDCDSYEDDDDDAL